MTLSRKGGSGDFDPNVEPETQEQADAYVNWCAENFTRLMDGTEHTYRQMVRCAHWLLVASTAQLHLDDNVDGEEGAALREQLAMYVNLARALERQRDRIPVDRLIVLRASLDCWETIGDWSANLLNAAKCAVAALILIDVHPLVGLWDLRCPDVLALLLIGRDELAAINVSSELEFADFAIRRDEMVTAKFTWQRAQNIARHMGAPPISES